jgi:signal transduction histidine kinase
VPFSELIENSIDFQPHGGMLTIRTGLAADETVRELTRQPMNGPVLQIEFIDHGPGLSEQDRERVFTPFYTRKAKGMGLGLSIVKGIIEAHRGVIREVGQSGELSTRVQWQAKPAACALVNPASRPMLDDGKGTATPIKVEPATTRTRVTRLLNEYSL